MSILRIVGSTSTHLWTVHLSSFLQTLFRQILTIVFVQNYTVFCYFFEIFRAKWIIQFYMSFHDFLGESTCCEPFPTFLLHILKRLPPTGDYFPQTQRPWIMLLLTVLPPPEGLALGGNGKKNILRYGRFILPTMLWSSSTSTELLSS